MLNATVNVLPLNYSELRNITSFSKKFPFRKLSIVFYKNIPISETFYRFLQKYSDFGNFSALETPLRMSA